MTNAAPEDDLATRLLRAVTALREEDLETALRELESAVGAHPRSVRAWTNYGAVLGELGRETEARRALETALALDPGAVEARSNLGVLAREGGRLDEAEACFRGIVAGDPANLAARYNLAHTLFLAARFAEAAAAYREGLRVDDAKTPNQNARLAWALLAAGRGKEARRELRRALERIDPREHDALLSEASEVLEAIVAAKPDLLPDAARLERLIKAGIPRAARGDFP